MAQMNPTEVQGDISQWSGYGTSSFGVEQGFTCSINATSSNFQTGGSYKYGNETFTTRLKLCNGGIYIELPELTCLGTASFYIGGGAGGTVHPSGTLHDYTINIEKYVDGNWELLTTIGEQCPKAPTMMKYDVVVNTKERIKLRIYNNDQSIWFCCVKLTAPEGGEVAPAQPWQSKLLSIDADGRLTYNQDADGFILNDWSQCGYMNGREEVPDVQVTGSRLVIVDPPSDNNISTQPDNTARINQAIQKVAALASDENGIRGVVLLKAGIYVIDGTINVGTDGVILRGEGNAFNQTDVSKQTRLYRRNCVNQAFTMVVLGTTEYGVNWWSKCAEGTGVKSDITTQKVMPGDWSFEVASTAGFNVGDAVYIKYPTSEKWLQELMYGGNTDADAQWKASYIDMCYYRYIEKIEGNRIYLDAPMYYTLDRGLAQSYVAKMNTTGYLVQKSAVENLDMSMDRTPTTSKTTAMQVCLQLSNCENCWVKEVSASNFIHSGIRTQSTTRSTIMNCYSVDPSGWVTGGNYYNFEAYQYSQLLLFKDCYARNGRHNFISNGCAQTSGLSVVNFKSDKPKTSSEGHRYLSQGILFDQWNEISDAPKTGERILGMYLRNNMGTAHGWGGTQCVMWNCNVKNGDIGLDKVPTGQNYAIGCTAHNISKYLKTNSDYTTGYIEGQNKSGLEPASLYEAQLNNYRLSASTALESIYTCTGEIMRTSIKDHHIVISMPENGELIIYSSGGKQCCVIPAAKGATVSSASLPSGIYFVKVNNMTKKAVVE